MPRGIELSEGAVEICRSRGVPASRTDLFSDELAPQSFENMLAERERLRHAEALLDDPDDEEHTSSGPSYRR